MHRECVKAFFVESLESNKKFLFGEAEPITAPNRSYRLFSHSTSAYVHIRIVMGLFFAGSMLFAIHFSHLRGFEMTFFISRKSVISTVV